MSNSIDELLDSFDLKKISCDLYNFKNVSAILNNENSGKISILNMNIRSLVKNYGKLLIFSDRVKYTFSIIILTETWLSDNNK